jgi:putative phosphoesterase
MTRILVLSDTHISKVAAHPGSDPALLEDLDGYLKAADLILHAGDHTGADFYRALQLRGDLISVSGNMDSFLLQSELPERKVLTCENVRIGILHGWGPSRGLEDRVYDAWPEDKPEIIIFGHSHRSHQSRRGKTLLFNPGSATDPSGPEATVGWLEIDRGTTRISLVSLPRHGQFP